MTMQNKLVSSFDYLDRGVAGSHYRDWYYEDDNNKDILLLSAGDSWTWGDSLGKIASGDIDDKEYRTRHIYGYHLSKFLDANFINIGIPGGSNLLILDHLRIILKNLNKNYKKIYIIITLTESARDLNSLDFVKDEYRKIKDPSWPTLEELPKQSKNLIDIILNDLNNLNANYLSNIINLYVKTASSFDVKSLFQSLDTTILEAILHLKSHNTKLLVGRNFTSWAVDTPNVSTVELRWTDVISKNGKLKKYPNNLYCLTHRMGFSRINDAIKNHLHNVKNWKEDLLIHMQNADNAISWLKESPYNANIASKHPLENAHLWWAQKIYEQFTKN